MKPPRHSTKKAAGAGQDPLHQTTQSWQRQTLQSSSPSNVMEMQATGTASSFFSAKHSLNSSQTSFKGLVRRKLFGGKLNASELACGRGNQSQGSTLAKLSMVRKLKKPCSEAKKNKLMVNLSSKDHTLSKSKEVGAAKEASLVEFPPSALSPSQHDFSLESSNSLELSSAEHSTLTQEREKICPAA